MKLFDPSKFTLTTAKPLPVILLLDTSGSMSGDKITALNQAVHEMFDTFRREAQDRLIVVSAITFGGGAARTQLV